MEVAGLTHLTLGLIRPLFTTSLEGYLIVSCLHSFKEDFGLHYPFDVEHEKQKDRWKSIGSGASDEAILSTLPKMFNYQHTLNDCTAFFLISCEKSVFIAIKFAWRKNFFIVRDNDASCLSVDRPKPIY